MLVDTKSIRAELAAVNREATALCAGLTVEQFSRRPELAKWSIAENLVHLIATTRVFLPVIDQAIAETCRRELMNPGPFRLGIYARLLLWYVEPPPVFRLRTPKLLRPRLSELSGEVLERFFDWQEAMAQRMQAASGLNLVSLRFPSPVVRHIRLNLLEFFSLLNAHSRRHLWHAANVRRCVLI
jgi:hypothetical protein